MPLNKETKPNQNKKVHRRLDYFDKNETIHSFFSFFYSPNFYTLKHSCADVEGADNCCVHFILSENFKFKA